MYEFWYNYIKPKYGDKAQLCYIDTDSFDIYIKTEDFYKDIADDVLIFILKLKTFIKILQMTLKNCSIYPIMMKMIKGLFQLVRTQKYQVFLKMN